MQKHWYIKNVIKDRVNQEADLEWAQSPTPALPKNISYPKPNLDKKSMTYKTAMYAFLKELKP
jgi:hypothetical protein